MTDSEKKLGGEVNKHRLTFADQIEGEKLAKVFNVQSFKEYNTFYVP